MTTPIVTLLLTANKKYALAQKYNNLNSILTNRHSFLNYCRNKFMKVYVFK